MQMHYVLANTKYGGDASLASNHKDGLVVLGTIFHASETNDTYMQPLLNALHRVKEEGSVTRLWGEQLALDDLMPEERELFFKYEGSLTTPPCSQSVTWIVFRDISAISERQINYFRAMTKHGRNNQNVGIGHNVRELQLTDGRTVYGSKGIRGIGHKNFLKRAGKKLAHKMGMKKEPAIKLL